MMMFRFQLQKCLLSMSCLLWVYVGVAHGQNAGRPAVQYTLGGQLVFWIGALAMVLFIGRFMFKEQLNERRTLRRLIREIGPFYPEFDIDHLKTWVNRCAPHVWLGWETGDWTAVDGFVTDNFKVRSTQFRERLDEDGNALECRLLGVLKIHPLGLYMTGDGPAPKDTELMLRLEQKAVYAVRNDSGKVIHGRADVDQVQHFWTLRHDGCSLRLDAVWLAEKDATDLADKPLPPVVTEWVHTTKSEPIQNT
jgi:hypothetical protein